MRYWWDTASLDNFVVRWSKSEEGIGGKKIILEKIRRTKEWHKLNASKFHNEFLLLKRIGFGWACQVRYELTISLVRRI